MAIWQQGTPTTGLDAGDRITIDGSGPVYVKVLSPRFKRNDGSDYCNIGYGVQVIVPPEYFEEE